MTMPQMPAERKIKTHKAFYVRGVLVPAGSTKVYPTPFAAEMVSCGKAEYADVWVGETTTPESTATLQLNPGNKPRKDAPADTGKDK